MEVEEQLGLTAAAQSLGISLFLVLGNNRIGPLPFAKVSQGNLETDVAVFSLAEIWMGQ